MSKKLIILLLSAAIPVFISLPSVRAEASETLELTQEIAVVTNADGTAGEVYSTGGGVSVVNPLKGAVFVLYETCSEKKNGRYVLSGEIAECETDETGFIRFSDLPDGVYYLQQKKAPAGYRKSSDILRIDLYADEEDDGIAVCVTAEVKNLSTGEEYYSSYRYETTGDGDREITNAFYSPAAVLNRKIVGVGNMAVMFLAALGAGAAAATAGFLIYGRIREKKGG